MYPQARDSLQCPYCAEMHAEDVEVCPSAGQVILLDQKYRLKRLIGEGSFGLVWDARNIDTQKEVAVKSLRAEVISDPAVLARFFWEATAAGRIHNRHVCDVLDLVKSSAHGPYIVLERLSGRSLESLILEERTLQPELAVHLVRQALIGLEAVHRAGIVHRDIKPENIFLHEVGEDRVLVKLLDFGISKFSATGASKTRTAADLFMGTPEYMSPEQARGAAFVDPRTDIWAIGAILYRALSGAPVFTGPDVPSVLTAILHFPHVPLAERAPNVPIGLAAAVDRCLSKDRDERYPSCADLSSALEPFEGHYAQQAGPDASGRVERSGLLTVFEASASVSLPEVEASREAARRVEVSGPRPQALGEHVIVAHGRGERRWFEHLREHLRTHRDTAQLPIWNAGDSSSRASRHDILADAFARARAVILLISPRFLTEELAPGGELYSLVLMAQERGLPVLWLMITETPYEGTDLLDFRTLGDPSQPLDRLPVADADRVLEEVCEQVVVHLGLPQTAPPRGGTRIGVPAGDTRLDGIRDLEQRIEAARARKARLEALGEDTRELHEEIKSLRRSLRMGRPLHRGDVLDERFVVLDQLGAGGFATVWRALDQTTDTPVALKVLHAQHVHNAERRERFFRGARIMAQIDHPNIVRIIEPSASDGEYEYFAMQFVSGGNLRDAVMSGRLSVNKRLQILLTVAEALAFAHERGIFHRDVKPSNILVSDDFTPYLTDFDLVRAEDTTGGTAGGLGTVIYAAPEMMERASEADARADVYGLGMTLAFLFYERDLTMDVIRNTDRLIGELSVPESIRMVIRTAITWNREHRFRTAAEFRAALSAAVGGRDGLPVLGSPVVVKAGGPREAVVGEGPSALAATLRRVGAPQMPRKTLPLGQVDSSVEIVEISDISDVSEAEVIADDVEVVDISDVGVAAPAPPAVPAAAEGGPNVSLVKAFAAFAEESEADSETAVSEVFSALEVHEVPASESEMLSVENAAARSMALRPLPVEDETLPDTLPGDSTRVVAAVVLGAAVVVTILYFMFVA
ncbi:serine/threonine-protein kinase [Nannocystis radixulma]|uniref:Serine/threonine-protein kinase n=1 Tax=Nannocystis radixulma TaxID=2995305 RepID=A0ABT5BNN7_9BACT|nr:serine/threonine-protein kinase [Nannocystis radixulma]MDC0675008.1 serine/threonine-protein kinase [Nannocystis radixulma]